MSRREAALAGAGLTAGLAVAGTVAALLHRTLRPVSEIARYAEATRVAADGVSANLAGAGAILRTRELAVALAARLAPEEGR